MTTIDVKEINEGAFHVTVVASSTTEHEVTVDATYAQKLTSGKISIAELVNHHSLSCLKENPIIVF